MAQSLSDQANLELLQAGLDHIDQGISVFDDRLNLMFWNRRYFDLLEFPLDFAQVGRPFEDFVRYNAERGEYGPGAVEGLVAERLARARQFTAHYLERPRPDGSILAIHGVPLPDGGFITVYTDITEQKETERLIQERNEELEQRVLERTRDLEATNLELRRLVQSEHETAEALKLSETRLQLITDAVPAGIAYVDLDERYRFANQRIAGAFGFAKDEIIGKSTDEVLGPKVAATLRPYLDRGRRGEEVTFEYVAELAEGREADIRTTVLPDLDEARQVRGYYALSLNVSNQKKAEAALAQAQKMEAVAGLSGGLSHDFNNLLTVVLGNLLPLKESGRLSREDLELLDPAIEAARRGAGLIRRLLTFSRRDPLEPQSVDLAALIEGFAGFLRSSLPETLEIAPEVGGEPLHAFVDPLGLESALLNLAFNARDAMPQGGRITIAVDPVAVDAAQGATLDLAPGDYVKIVVADEGSGIDPATLARAFEPFFTTKAQGSGSGLGLAMVYGFAKQSGGAVRIASEDGRGAEVSLYIPRSEAPAVPQAGPEPLDAAVDGSRPLVLLVDDDPGVRRVARRQLTDLGYPTVEASDGEAALELLDQVGEIGILLSDVVMPGPLNGFDLARAAQTKRPDLKVLLMSAYRQPDADREAGRPQVPVLRKPFEKPELDRLLRQISTAEAAARSD